MQTIYISIIDKEAGVRDISDIALRNFEPYTLTETTDNIIALLLKGKEFDEICAELKLDAHNFSRYLEGEGMDYPATREAFDLLNKKRQTELELFYALGYKTDDLQKLHYLDIVFHLKII